ncbi:MAG: DUF4942 domain-containing protein [Clostridia bacterium]|nr:DUF4942 domain-containing protein [Clostridia bacterium]
MVNRSYLGIAGSSRAQKTFYPTPDALADKLFAGIDWREIGSILEPSAGKGNLAQYCARKRFGRTHSYPPHDDYSWREAIERADIDCIEIDPTLRAVLEDRGFRVVHDDFLTFETQKRYDLIAMNPPFDEGAEHLLKAMEICERGGIILCILNAETIRNPYSLRRDELMKKLNQYGATIQYVKDAFRDAERKTDVEVALVKVEIPRVKIDSTIVEEMRKAPTYKTQTVSSEYAGIVQYDEIEKWVNRHNFEAACGIRLIEEYQAMRDMLSVNPDEKYSWSPIEMTVRGQEGRGVDATVNAYLKQVRGKYWRTIFQQPVITNKLTSNLQNELHDSVSKLQDYEFSAFNILSLIIKMNQKVLTGIEDTIIGLFDNWTARSWHEDSPNRHYYNGWKTNDCFRIGKKVILPFYGSYDSWDQKFRSYNVISKFADIEKVFDFLDSGRTEWEGTLENALKLAEATGNTKNIDTKYFTATFFKKGTAHLVFKDMDLLEKFNLFAGQKKGWLPPNYGKKRYRDMSAEEQHVVDSFQGREKYEEIMAKADYFLDTDAGPLLIGAPV